MILLENCPYGINAKKQLDESKIPYIITTVNNSNKENYKTDYIKTFPQLYLKKKNNNESLLLGGYNDLMYVINNLNINNYSEFQNKYNMFSKKSTLRLIELLHQK